MSEHNKGLWLLAAALASLAIAVVAAVIFSATGKTALESLLYGGGAFAASMLVCIGVIGVL
ncbi:hypothetical protein [Streptomyces cinerochromogenes]|uniref:hypothetical protein n=1 Tax=Streptomyces cinerochromogenes TaxID=66422 RepID=UPI00167016D6|nr:hypothetical protein [Streptomyces cinerochromogenes]GGS82971.1 hypothetical protein GCM10010206_51940 [Streptomyces cinerochromogenes]